MVPITLATLLPAEFDASRCKVNFAVHNGEAHPIDVLGNDPGEWQRWNSWRNVNDDFNRQFIFSLAQDRHDTTLWLFGGSGRSRHAVRSREHIPTMSSSERTSWEVSFAGSMSAWHSQVETVAATWKPVSTS
ncbi:hypothetical protein [Nocardioides alcanivorans]|uniref:hypothetical protein n=1 Tax=Nocardioides alcanivorans TaxID=2897352 RepID=UPI001F3BA79B|nr:hypothetical protein [Nocardioides alcanivorans]